MTNLANGKIVEHIDKTSGKYPHDKQYVIINCAARSKDVTTGEWYDAVIYGYGDEMFVREYNDFVNKFKYTNYEEEYETN